MYPTITLTFIDGSLMIDESFASYLNFIATKLDHHHEGNLVIPIKVTIKQWQLLSKFLDTPLIPKSRSALVLLLHAADYFELKDKLMTKLISQTFQYLRLTRQDISIDTLIKYILNPYPIQQCQYVTTRGINSGLRCFSNAKIGSYYCGSCERKNGATKHFSIIDQRFAHYDDLIITAENYVKRRCDRIEDYNNKMYLGYCPDRNPEHVLPLDEEHHRIITILYY